MHGHHHSHEHSAEHSREGNKKALTIALMITTGIMLLEFIGGIITNSLALLSDAGHMLSDVSSLLLSLIAIWLAARPPSPQKTFGYYRFEIFAALLNGVTLFFIAGFIMWEAYDRFLEPPVVSSGPMILIATIGLLANALSAYTLLKKGDTKENVNVRSAYIHILGDALGSVGAIIAGVLMLFFSLYIADPIISVIVALLILKSAWGVISQALHILSEGTPPNVNFAEVQEALRSIKGVVNVHDLHIWTITSGLNSLSCHLQILDNADEQSILQRAIDIIKDKYNIHHTTIQVEKSQLQHSDLTI